MKTMYIKPSILVIAVKTQSMMCGSIQGMSSSVSNESIEENNSVLSRERGGIWGGDDNE